jgi:hypothetical protein
VFNLSRALVEQGHRVEVVTVQREKKLPYRSSLDGVQVFRIPVLSIPKTLTTQYPARSAAVILNIHRQSRVDLVHCHTFWPDVFTAFALRPFTPMVYTVHESYFLIMAEQGKFQRRLRLAMSPFGEIIAPSTELLSVA